MVAARLPDGDVLVTGLPLGATRAAVGQLITVEVAAGLAGLLVTAIAGTLVVRRTLRPLSHVAATATRVTSCRWPAARWRCPSGCPRRTPAPATRSARWAPR